MLSLATSPRITDDNPPPANPMLPVNIRGLGYSVNGAPLIDNLDIDLDPGTRTVVMGANGAGKSLLLRLMHGLLTPTTGEISWGGKPLDKTTRARQAMVFQRPVLLRRSVQANVEFVLNLVGLAGADRAVRILEQVGLDRQAKRAARQLSGGEQQRLALARALALEPLVLFLDEPAANLDPAATASIEMIINGFHEQGTKIVLVTHDVGQARRIADDVIFLHHGRLIEHTEASEFFEDPVSTSAQLYLAGSLVF